MALTKKVICCVFILLFSTLTQTANAQTPNRPNTPPAPVNSPPAPIATPTQTPSNTPILVTATPNVGAMTALTAAIVKIVVKKKPYTYITSYMNEDSSKAGCPQPSSPDSALDTESKVTITALSGKTEYLWQCKTTIKIAPKVTPPKFPKSTPDSVVAAPQSESAIPDDWGIDSAGNHYTYFKFKDNRFVPTSFTGSGILCDTGAIQITCSADDGATITQANTSYKQLVVSSKATETNLSCQISSSSCKGTVDAKAGTITTMQCCNNNLNGGPWACQKDTHEASRWDGTFTVCGGGSSWMCPNPLTPCS